jgi:tetratricopeptide (TPR) repeat protein
METRLFGTFIKLFLIFMQDSGVKLKAVVFCRFYPPWPSFVMHAFACMFLIKGLIWVIRYRFEFRISYFEFSEHLFALEAKPRPMTPPRERGFPAQIKAFANVPWKSDFINPKRGSTKRGLSYGPCTVIVIYCNAIHLSTRSHDMRRTRRMVQHDPAFFKSAGRRCLCRIAWIILIGALFPACASGPQPASMPKDLREAGYYAREAASHFNRGCYADALADFQDAHERYAAADRLEGVARSLNGIANIYYQEGEMQSAVMVYDDAIEVYETLKDLPGVIQALCNKAAASIALGRLDIATAALQKADSLDRGGRQTALRLKTRALLAIKKKNLQQAGQLLKQAQASAGSNKPLISGIYYALGYVGLMTDHPARAQGYFDQALKLDRAAGAHHDIARDLEGLGTCSARLGDHRQALNYFKRSAKIYALLQDNRHAAEVIPQLKKSAAQAGVDVQATLSWIQQWMLNPGGAALCD